MKQGYVYIVTTGVYDDEEIVYVCTTREEAEENIKLFDSPHRDIQIYKLELNTRYDCNHTLASQHIIYEYHPQNGLYCKNCVYHTEYDECCNPAWMSPERKSFPIAYDFNYCALGKGKT